MRHKDKFTMMMVKTNTGTIRNRFKILLAEKETRDGHRYTYADIQNETGIAASTLTNLAKGTIRYYSADTMAALCFFFACQPGDLLEFLPPSETSEAKRPAKSKGK